MVKTALMESLEQPAAEKAKEAEIFTCNFCSGQYTDARGSGGGSKMDYRFCSNPCRAAKKSAPQKKKECKHGRQKGNKCKDCDTGHCKHGRQKNQCTVQ